MRLSDVVRSDALLQQALTHPSFANENPGTPSNQRLEFLGDAVVGLVVTELLYEARADWPEGELSRARSSLVNTQVFERIGVELGLDRALRASKGLARKGKLVADAFEALVGAVWLEGGLPAAHAFLDPLIRPRIAGLAPEKAPIDACSRLQELLQARHAGLPDYHEREVPDSPDHDRKWEASVTVDGKTYGPAVASRKKQAKAAAAALALAALAPEAAPQSAQPEATPAAQPAAPPPAGAKNT